MKEWRDTSRSLSLVSPVVRGLEKKLVFRSFVSISRKIRAVSPLPFLSDSFLLAGLSFLICVLRDSSFFASAFKCGYAWTRSSGLLLSVETAPNFVLYERMYFNSIPLPKLARRFRFPHSRTYYMVSEACDVWSSKRPMKFDFASILRGRSQSYRFNTWPRARSRHTESSSATAKTCTRLQVSRSTLR